ncbi:sigma-70 family RNA polymerase sigma factor [Solibacillus sp. FSL H8-0538]|uniref:sigma-70 family RNA polymerase sigma factor n=1 Tax=Solibacillus sp. FSL H8-0538 TaxID=2921400 RepID=UPI0030FCBDCB
MQTEQLEAFIKIHGEELLRLAFTYVKNREIAEDIVQDVLLKAFEKRTDFRGGSSYRTYLFRMTINRCHDYLRSWHYKNTFVTTKIQSIFKGSVSAEQLVLENDESKLLGHAVLKLPVKYREVIVFYYYKEMSTEEIAELMQCPVNTIKTRLKRGREKLKVELDGSALYEGFQNQEKYW